MLAETKGPSLFIPELATEKDPASFLYTAFSFIKPS